MEYYSAYLRKSRKDIDAEAHGQGETLARHEKRLRNYADSVGIKINKFYKEVVSGETISSRPVMQQLLTDVENGLWTGVLVIEVERLARGNTLDQGIVSNAFQYSNTKIITPLKTYDPNNDYDEEYFEFGLFMSRREYKKINQRLHEGILVSVNEGKHVASSAPYGYDKYKLPKQKGYSLKINQHEANMIQLIYHLYCSGKGLEFICNKLNALGYKPRRSTAFTKSTITHILTNPVYIGKIKYIDKATTKKIVNGDIVRVKNQNKNIIYVDGLHEPIIDLDIWNMVQNIRNNNLICRTKVDYTLKNPMASILKCGLCGKSLSRISYSHRNDIRIGCRNCKENVGSNFDCVEDRLLQAMKSLLESYKIVLKTDVNNNIKMLCKLNEDSLLDNKRELEQLKHQLIKIYDLFEQNVYTKEIFLERSNLIEQRIAIVNSNIEKIKLEKEKLIGKQNYKELLIPKFENVLDTYYATNDIMMKNRLLKSVLNKVVYLKVSPKGKDDFCLTLFPKLY